ncbi:MAG: four helix bundle protein [Candidatus Liptonbacteria bacterium]|nr:four helix bundle protein [Candidatus Liptonbacteria bacterium]
MENDYKKQFYQRVYKYGLEIIQRVENLPKDQASRILGNQLLRSGTSVAANIIEAKSASSKRDYINFYHHALGCPEAIKSANESKLWICYLRDAKKITKEQSKKILKETEEIANILAASIITMKNKRKI